MAVPSPAAPAQVQQLVLICMYFNICEMKGASGMSALAPPQPTMVTWQRCSGCTSRDVRGKRKRFVTMQLRVAA
eukprot:4244-Heterococcus_DN1.PRE.2